MTLIFAAISILLYPLFIRVFNKVHLIIAAILVVVFSTMQAYVFLYIAWFIYGPWLGAFSFPIFYNWLIAIVAANFYILIQSGNKFSFKHFIGISGVGLAVCFVIFLFGVFQNLRASDQNFDVICLSWTPSEITPELEDLTKWSLT